MYYPRTSFTIYNGESKQHTEYLSLSIHLSNTQKLTIFSKHNSLFPIPYLLFYLVFLPIYPYLTYKKNQFFIYYPRTSFSIQNGENKQYNDHLSISILLSNIQKFKNFPKNNFLSLIPYLLFSMVFLPSKVFHIGLPSIWLIYETVFTKKNLSRYSQLYVKLNLF